MMELKGKKVLVVGLGKSGLAAALFLRRRGAQVTVSDMRSAEALAKDIPALLEEGINVEAGGHGLLTFRRQDLIVVSPGVPLDTPELAQVRSFGLPVIGELELAARFLKGKMLAITGSNGKTTTTTLVGEILKEAGLPTLVGGNIGVPVVGLIDESTDETWSVLEVSSFQLESTEQFHPAIAVILNITPDHLDRHGTLRELRTGQGAHLCRAERETISWCSTPTTRAPPRRPSRSVATVYWFSIEHPVSQGAWVEEWLRSVYRAAKDAQLETVMPLSGIPLKGEHNVENVLAAVLRRTAGRSARRMRFARPSRTSRPSSTGWNTSPPSTASSSTTTPRPPTSTPPPRPSPLSPPAFTSSSAARTRTPTTRSSSDLLRARVRAVYTIGSAAAKIESQLRGVVSIHSCETLESAVTTAAAAAHPGEVVLLAPACSSFDQFENYEHRGRIFKELVHEWRGWKVWQNA